MLSVDEMIMLSGHESNLLDIARSAHKMTNSDLQAAIEAEARHIYMLGKTHGHHEAEEVTQIINTEKSSIT